MRNLFTATIRTVVFYHCFGVVLCDLFGNGGNRKQLVVFAGPHKTSETDVEEFFYKYARGDNPDYDAEKSLLGWSWPQVFGLGSPHRVYDRLVVDFDDADVQTKILDSLVSHFNESSRGLIIGGDEYDRVGKTSWSGRDAVASIENIMAATGIEENDVTIILLYKRPRIDQWLSIFTHEILNVSSSNFRDEYEEFLCDPSTAAKRLETLETAMNPFHVSTSFINAGFNVVMIDLEGARDANVMIEHIIGCQILDGKCTDGLLDNLDAESFLKYHKREDEALHVFHSLATNDVENLEKLFRLRDCDYRSMLENAKFRFLYQKDAFKSCPKQTSDKMNSLFETSVLFEAIRSQKECNTRHVDLAYLLEEAPEVNVANVLKYTDKDQAVTEIIVEKTKTNVSESMDEADAETSLEPQVDEAASLEPKVATETSLEPDGDEGTSLEPEESDADEAIYFTYTVVIILGVIVGMGFMMRSWSRKRWEARHTQGGIDGIMPMLHEDKNRSLNELM